MKELEVSSSNYLLQPLLLDGDETVISWENLNLPLMLTINKKNKVDAKNAFSLRAT